ncbi:methylenetetrahydrofolate reductase [Salinifilum aidingensis]
MTTQDRFSRSLEAARYEVLPLRGVFDEVAHLSPGTCVTVTSAQAKGIDATLETAEQLARRDLQPVPHLAARLVRDSPHLERILDRLAAAGIDEVFVIGGDAAECGEFPDALSLLQAMERTGRRPQRVGIGGYPERHASIPDDVLAQALADKSRYADYIVSQICFDTETILAWVKDLRERGLTQPVYVGMPGAVDARKLMRISLKIGLGESMRFLRKQSGVVSKLLTRYTPQDIVDGLMPYLDDPEHGIAGWHLYTFNEVAKTVEWRQEAARRIGEVPA